MNNRWFWSFLLPSQFFFVCFYYLILVWFISIWKYLLLVIIRVWKTIPAFWWLLHMKNLLSFCQLETCVIESCLKCIHLLQKSSEIFHVKIVYAGQLVVASLLARNIQSRIILRDPAKATSLFGIQDEEKLQV